MAKDKKGGRKVSGKAKANEEPIQLIAGPSSTNGKKKAKSKDKDGAGAAKHNGGGLDALAKLAGHPLVGDLLAVGALAAVAAIAESGKGDPAAVKSTQAVKAAGKAAAAAIGARLLKEMASGSGKTSSN